MKDLKIEAMRIRLSGLVVAKNFDMQDPDVISLSKELDRLIVDFEKAKQQVLQSSDYTKNLSFS
ncbi:MAG: Spo0E like sporulation regulatory protein [Firmicutes bacterium]|nr:Spo0E like sporulation regulatory protein [Bacillota bacterium]